VALFCKCSYYNTVPFQDKFSALNSAENRFYIPGQFMDPKLVNVLGGMTKNVLKRIIREETTSMETKVSWLYSGPKAPRQTCFHNDYDQKFVKIGGIHDIMFIFITADDVL
jgi:hypothetical protein